MVAEFMAERSASSAESLSYPVGMSSVFLSNYCMS
jgi:hypothetical protein